MARKRFHTNTTTKSRTAYDNSHLANEEMQGACTPPYTHPQKKDRPSGIYIPSFGGAYVPNVFTRTPGDNYIITISDLGLCCWFVWCLSNANEHPSFVLELNQTILETQELVCGCRLENCLPTSCVRGPLVMVIYD